MHEINIFEDALKTVNRLGHDANIGAGTLNYLSHPEQLITVSLPIRMDSGVIKIFQGYRSRYNTVLGPAKGGVRFDPSVNSQDVNALALWMTIKTSLVGLPYGGGKGGVCVDTNTLSILELERLSRAYIRAIADEIGAYIDVMAPDVATNDTIMAWMVDEYEKIARVKSPAAITGKPVELGGSLFRTESTGFGAATLTKIVTEKMNIDHRKTTVAIQGFGNVGSHIAKYLHAIGFKVVAISDVSGGVYAPDGIDVRMIFDEFKAKNSRGTTLENSGLKDKIPNAESINNHDILELDVDVLIPAAKSDVITEVNAENIKARCIIEAANGPISSEAVNILNSKNTMILPDVLANSGGVIVSYFEWVQNIQCYYWGRQKIQNELVTILNNAFDAIWEIHVSEEKTLRSAAYSIALRRLEKAFNIRYAH